MAILTILFLIPETGKACTTALISGKATINGRPLLFKQRDSGYLHNRMQLFNDGKYTYMGLCDQEDPKGNEVWGGFNETGFAIINSASYNLNGDDSSKTKDREGFIMKRALQQCATLADFEKLLHTLPRPLGCNTNFGVIDAQGGAAYYETGNQGFKKYDANDPQTAPDGYLIRTNFCFSGDRTKDKGIARYHAAEELFAQANLTHAFSTRFLLNDVVRSLKHGITGADLSTQMPANGDKRTMVPFRDYIIRNSTASTLLIEGITPNENPRLTTLWAIVGSPLTSIAIPLWLLPETPLPSIVTANKEGSSPLCEWALKWKKRLFPIQTGEGEDYLDLSKLLNRTENGIWQHTRPVQDAVAKKGEDLLREEREKGMDPQKTSEFYQWVDQFITNFYETLQDDYDYYG